MRTLSSQHWSREGSLLAVSMARVGVVFSPPVMMRIPLLLYFGQPAGIAFGSCGPCCCSVFHDRADIACVGLSKDAAVGPPVGASLFFS